jgi:hypothetical protein
MRAKRRRRRRSGGSSRRIETGASKRDASEKKPDAAGASLGAHWVASMVGRGSAAGSVPTGSTQGTWG